MQHQFFDVVVIGSGGAGLRAAIEAQLKGAKTCVISKGPSGLGTSTVMSAGSFAGATEGEWALEHGRQALESGRGLNDLRLVKVLVEEGPFRIKELVAWGMKGKIEGGFFTAVGKSSALGKEIIRCLLEKAKAFGVHFIDFLTVYKVTYQGERPVVLAYASQKGEWLVLSAAVVILATGGASALYARHDNPHRMVGDGYALAFQAGATLQDMEFVQFHPWGLADQGRPSVPVPAVLVEFGELTNSEGEEFFEKYRIQEKPSADSARDIYSQLVFREIYQRKKEVFLDLTRVSKEQWCRDSYAAPTWEMLGGRFGAWQRPLRLAPVAHHVMGGVTIDSRGGTSLPWLFAAGEVAGGVHGANRFGGYALTETVVFGARAGESAAEFAKSQGSGSRAEKEVSVEVPSFAVSKEQSSQSSQTSCPRSLHSSPME